MRNFLFFVCLLWILSGTECFVLAQPAQKSVNVVISPDHADWHYKAGEEATFQVQVLQFGSLLKNVTVDYELVPEFFPATEKKDLLLKERHTTTFPLPRN